MARRRRHKCPLPRATVTTNLHVYNMQLHVCVYKVVHFISVSDIRITGGELFDEIVAREYYSETDARYIFTRVYCGYTVPYEGILRHMRVYCAI